MTEEKTKAVAVVQPQTALVKPVASADEMIKHHEEIGQLIVKSLKEGTDYGPIPGTKTKVLKKPGAERINLAMGAVPKYTLLDSSTEHDQPVDWEKKKYGRLERGKSRGLYRYVYKCSLTRPDGRVLGEGDGACSTLESKYIEMPRNYENTVLKMAQKRALVAATLNAYALSDRFTQDLEDEDKKDIKPATVYTGTPTQKSFLFEEAKKHGATKEDKEELSLMSESAVSSQVTMEKLPELIKTYYEEKGNGKS